MYERECVAEFVDGSWTAESCGCEDCCEQLHDEIEHRVEAGLLTDDEAREEHGLLDAAGYRGD